MTKEEILAMEAGRELNKLVGENIFGFEVKDFWPAEPKPSDYSYHMRVPSSEYKAAWDLLPHYSEDIWAAWPVVEKMQENKEPYYYLELRYSRILHCWMALFEYGSDQHEEIEGKTAPEAICKAALLAKCS